MRADTPTHIGRADKTTSEKRSRFYDKHYRCKDPQTLHDGRLRAIVSVTLDDAIALHDIKVIEGPNRLFVAMPSRRDDNGVYRDIVHPISSKERSAIEERILSCYQSSLAAQ